jgi:hypothetical protein
MLSLLPLAIAAAFQAETLAGSSDDGSVIMWVAARPENCNLNVAKKVTLESLIQQSDDWAGKCVAVSGYWYGRALFESPSDAREKYSQSSDELAGHRVGIYGREEVLEAAPKRPKRFVAVGIASTCERLWDGAMMVMGYCHYTGGPIIAVAELRPR